MPADKSLGVKGALCGGESLTVPLSLQERFTGVLAPRAEEKLPRTSLSPQKHHSLHSSRRLQRRFQHSGGQEALLRSLTTHSHLTSGVPFVEGQAHGSQKKKKSPKCERWLANSAVTWAEGPQDAELPGIPRAG